MFGRGGVPFCPTAAIDNRREATLAGDAGRRDLPKDDADKLAYLIYACCKAPLKSPRGAGYGFVRLEGGYRHPRRWRAADAPRCTRWDSGRRARGWRTASR